MLDISKIDDVYVLVLAPFWVSFWRSLGSLNGGQKHEQVVPKVIQTHAQIMIDFVHGFWGPIWGPKRSQTGYIKGSCLKQCRHGVPDVLQGPILNGFLMLSGSLSVCF